MRRSVASLILLVTTCTHRYPRNGKPHPPALGGRWFFLSELRLSRSRSIRSRQWLLIYRINISIALSSWGSRSASQSSGVIHTCTSGFSPMFSIGVPSSR